MKKNANKTTGKKVFREWVESILIAFVLAIFIRTFVVQAFRIPTGSMRTTLMEGDVILVNKFIYGAKVPFLSLRLPALRKPVAGDVVVFIYPEDPKKDFIKRLVACGGDTVEIKNGTIFVNGQPLLEGGFGGRYYYNRGEYGREADKIIVPQGQYFVLGDNSASSQDSRYWGFVPQENLLGKAVFIYWPPQRLRVIQ
jgi:signal peptidase I